MHCLEKYLINLLQGKIIYDEKIVEVRKHYDDAPLLPLITLDTSAGVSTNYSYHELTNVDTLYFNRDATVNISVWCNTEEQRQSITQQIMECYYKEKNFHYTYCSNYHNGICNTSGSKCGATTITNNRTVKDKCPDPDWYKYESLQSKCYIVHDTITIEPAYDIDEVQQHPPLLHSILRCTATYEEPVSRYGMVVEDINYNTD